ncbi:hypothetical protein DFH09DRAFT_1292531 [Mycena vulgaris]|nr:hypothetical protein DFH09DRAFT_1292531 [Mycena vulgaris]
MAWVSLLPSRWAQKLLGELEMTEGQWNDLRESSCMRSDSLRRLRPITLEGSRRIFSEITDLIKGTSTTIISTRILDTSNLINQSESDFTMHDLGRENWRKTHGCDIELSSFQLRCFSPEFRPNISVAIGDRANKAGWPQDKGKHTKELQVSTGDGPPTAVSRLLAGWRGAARRLPAISQDAAKTRRPTYTLLCSAVYTEIEDSRFSTPHEGGKISTSTSSSLGVYTYVSHKMKWFRSVHESVPGRWPLGHRRGNGGPLKIPLEDSDRFGVKTVFHTLKERGKLKSGGQESPDPRISGTYPPTGLSGVLVTVFHGGENFQRVQSRAKIWGLFTVQCPRRSRTKEHDSPIRKRATEPANQHQCSDYLSRKLPSLSIHDAVTLARDGPRLQFLLSAELSRFNRQEECASVFIWAALCE